MTATMFMLVKLTQLRTASRALMFSVLLLGLGACASVGTTNSGSNAAASLESTAPPNFTRGLLARAAVTPLYPIRARTLGIEGWVMLRFTVNEDGAVVSNTIEVIEEDPRGYFDLSAINAARRLTFENTRGEPVEDVRYVFRYELEELNRAGVVRTAPELQFRELIPRRYITPNYPPNAEQQGIEGFVVVQFTVTAEGGVDAITIIESDPPGIFDNEALVAASRLRFEPRLIFGRPVNVEDVTFRFDWRLPQ